MEEITAGQEVELCIGYSDYKYILLTGFKEEKESVSKFCHVGEWYI